MAAASVGQVYRAKMSGRDVAVKVQRPDVREQVTLDLFVVRQIASIGGRIFELPKLNLKILSKTY